MEQDKLAQSLDVYEKALDSADRAEDNLQRSLTQIKKFAAKSTFEVKGQYYQVRERKGRLYMCNLDGPPKGRPKKTPEEKAAAALQRAEKKAAAKLAEAEAAAAAEAAETTTVEMEDTVIVEEDIGIKVDDDPNNTSPSTVPPAAPVEDQVG